MESRAGLPTELINSVFIMKLRNFSNGCNYLHWTNNKPLPFPHWTQLNPCLDTHSAVRSSIGHCTDVPWKTVRLCNVVSSSVLKRSLIDLGLIPFVCREKIMKRVSRELDRVKRL